MNVQQAVVAESDNNNDLSISQHLLSLALSRDHFRIDHQAHKTPESSTLIFEMKSTLTHSESEKKNGRAGTHPNPIPHIGNIKKENSQANKQRERHRTEHTI